MDTIYSVKRARQEKSLERLERLVEAFEQQETSAETLKKLKMTREEYLWCEVHKEIFVKCAEECRTYDYAVKLVTDHEMKNVNLVVGFSTIWLFSVPTEGFGVVYFLTETEKDREEK